MLLFGPTASGKTELLRGLLVGGGPSIFAEVVSADSMQVYRGMDIGTAKPSPEFLRTVPHHLIDIRDPREQFNAGDFVRLADGACRDIHSRGNIPILSGGTGFYLKNFVLGLPEAPPSDPATRERLKADLEAGGVEPLLRELELADPVSARRIHPNDTYRLLRALEVYRSSGRPLSSFSSAGAPPGGSGASGRPAYRFLLVALQRNREDLYRRIDLRTRDMFSRGLAAEAADLVESGYGPQDPGMRAIGYKEFFELPEEDLRHPSSAQLESLMVLVARNSRRYAKRQILYFSGLPDVHRLDLGDDPSRDSAALRKLLIGFLP